jgi:hypothetical protein
MDPFSISDPKKAQQTIKIGVLQSPVTIDQQQPSRFDPHDKFPEDIPYCCLFSPT